MEKSHLVVIVDPDLLTNLIPIFFCRKDSYVKVVEGSKFVVSVKEKVRLNNPGVWEEFSNVIFVNVGIIFLKLLFLKTFILVIFPMKSKLLNEFIIIVGHLLFWFKSEE